MISLAHFVSRNSFRKKMIKMKSSESAGVSVFCLQNDALKFYTAIVIVK